jgi:hypothetical protein
MPKRPALDTETVPIWRLLRVPSIQILYTFNIYQGGEGLILACLFIEIMARSQ